MNARDSIKIQSGLDAGAVRIALATARLQLAALLDSLVAGWLERCATNAEAAQRLLTHKTDPDAQA
jgi:hypothetical protein